MWLITVNWFLVQNGIDSHYIYCNAWVSVQLFPLTRHNSDLLHRAQGKPDFLILIEHRRMSKKIELFEKQTICPLKVLTPGEMGLLMGLVAKSLSVTEVLFPPPLYFGHAFPCSSFFLESSFLQLSFPGLCRDIHLGGLKLQLNFTLIPLFYSNVLT